MWLLRWILIPWSCRSGGEFREAESETTSNPLQQQTQQQQNRHHKAAQTQRTPAPAAGFQVDVFIAAKRLIHLPLVQSEGQINRLKMLKRQMYGRAGFDLLRKRVLCAA